MASTKLYESDFWLLTILMAFVSLFEELCRDATVFFAMLT